VGREKAKCAGVNSWFAHTEFSTQIKCARYDEGHAAQIYYVF